MADLQLPGSTGSKSYIEATEITFKAKAWCYNYYDKDAGKAFDVDNIEWIIIWQWFQFNQTKTATKSKWVTVVSNEFWFDLMKSWDIYMKELVRDKSWFNVNSLWKKTYQQWKDEWLKLVKLVYVLDKNDMDKIYRIVFAWMSFAEINKLIKKDAPNFISKFWVSETAEETDNWDFYTPTLEYGDRIPDSASDKILEKIKFVDAILNKKELEEPQPELTVNDLPF